MKILVPVKRGAGYNVKIWVKPDDSGVVLDNVKMSKEMFDPANFSLLEKMGRKF